MVKENTFSLLLLPGQIVYLKEAFPFCHPVCLSMFKRLDGECASVYHKVGNAGNEQLHVGGEKEAIK